MPGITHWTHFFKLEWHCFFGKEEEEALHTRLPPCIPMHPSLTQAIGVINERDIDEPQSLSYILFREEHIICHTLLPILEESRDYT